MQPACKVYAAWLKTNNNSVLKITVILYKLLAKAIESKFEMFAG